MRLQLSSKESRWCVCGKQILTDDMRFVDDGGNHICLGCRGKEKTPEPGLTFWRKFALGQYN